MQEDLLQYIWRFQYFNGSELFTSSGEPVQIIHPGNHNYNQGPDFTGAKIKISQTLWAGNIELHINSSDWKLHQHATDSNYKNIILHVVWNNDGAAKDLNGNDLPTFELKSRVSKMLLQKYRELMETAHFIPCEGQVRQVSDLVLASWKQRLIVERLTMKSKKVLSVLGDTNFHWEETFWRLIAANFGLTVNSDFFQRLAATLPVAILAKHKNRILLIESLLFGQAGLLESAFQEPYPLMLQKEYRFYRKKYKLKPLDGELFFLRMRPANFPTIRLAQLAMLIHESEHLFSKIKDASSLKAVKQMLDVRANDYWHYHYVFDQQSVYKEKNLGRQMVDNIIINTIIPALFAFGIHQNETSCKDKAIQWLYELAAEKNRITKGFEDLDFLNKNAFDSQALIQLKNEYCDKRLCLHCSIGNALLKHSS